MAEMDIYMRRRLVALGGLVLFFILFVLLVKSCGGDDEAEPVSTAPLTGTTGATGAALSEEDFILQADEICGPANDQVGSLDPTDTNATQDEFAITSDELASLEALELAEPSPNIERFLADLSAVVSGLKDKAQAVKSGDIAAQDAAQLEIDTAEVDARAAGERAGFSECGQFLDAGEGSSGGGGGGGAAVAPTAPADPAAPAAPTAPTEPTAPTAPTTPTEPAPPDTGGGITP